MESYIYIDHNPTGPGYVFGVVGKINQTAKIFRSANGEYSENDHRWIETGSKRSALAIAKKVIAKYPDTDFRDNTK